MARILIATWPFGGHTLPHVEIARTLLDRQHDVAMYNSPAVAPFLESEGIPHLPYRRLTDRRFESGLIRRQQNLSWTNPVRVLKMCATWVLDSVPQQVADLEDILADFRPDVLLCDEIMWSGTLVLSEKHNLPMAVLSTFAGCMLPGPDAPHFGLGIPPKRSLAGRLGNKLASRLADRIARPARRQASQYRVDNGLPPYLGPVRELAARAGVYMARGTPEWDYERRDLPASVRYIGPLVWSGERNALTPEWVSSLPRGKPVIYVSEGTLQSGPPEVLRAAVNGLGGLDLQVVMTTGRCGALAKLDIDPLPDNVRLESWVPEQKLFRHTDVVVSVGGAGTVLGALAAGVPLVVIPSESDQPDNARRVVECGAGIWLPHKRCSPQTLRAAVEHVLREPSFRRNAQRMQQFFAAYDSRQLAADLIEGLVQKVEPNEVRESLLFHTVSANSGKIA